MTDTRTSTSLSAAQAHPVGAAFGLLALVAAVLLIWAPGARADLSFCDTGPGAGECENPTDAANDRETGRLYIADQGNNRVSVFEEDGTFVMAFGWGVKDGSAELQKCTTGTGCLKGLSGSGAGQLGGWLRIAVDNDPASPSHHDVYVGQETRHRVQKFDPEGNFLRAFGKGVNAGTSGNPDLCTNAGPPTDVCGDGSEGSALGQFNEMKGIGVSSGGAVYVADQKSEGVNCENIGDGEKSEKRVQVFDEMGLPIEESLPSGIPCANIDGFAVDSTGAFYVANQGASRAIRKYEAGPVLCEVDKGVETTALAVDDEDNLLSAQGVSRITGGSYRLISRYDDSCNPVGRFAYGSFQFAGVGLAATGGGIFTAESGEFSSSGNRAFLLTPPPPGPFIVPASVEADPISNAKATLVAEVNPNGKESKVRFEYLDKESFEEQGGFTGPATKSLEASIGADFKLHAAEVLAGCPDPASEASLPESKCLIPETTYRFRVIATNADGAGNSPIEGEFTTKPPLEIGAPWSTEVGTDTATLHGEANPLGVPATGYFEYVDDATFQASGFAEASQAPDVAGGEAPLEFGSGEDFTAREASLYPLEPGTSFHYRLVVENPLVEPIAGPERTFKTFIAKKAEPCPANEAFRIGPSALLPDCRAYELVSPLDKANGDILVLTETFSGLPSVLNQSSVSGGRLAYGSYRSFGGAVSAPWTSQYIATRGAEGWRSHAISPPRERLIWGEVFGYDLSEFKVFSPDLCETWLRTGTDPPLAPGALEGVPNIYRQVDEECGGKSYEALTTRSWENLIPSDPFSPSAQAQMELQGVSADGAKAIFIAPDSLAESGAPNIGGGKDRLYAWSAASGPVFACVLPSGEALADSCSAGMNVTSGGGKNQSADVQGAISEDGTRVFWTARAGGAGKIYMREHAEQGQVAGECTEAGIACTIAVSAKGEELSGKSKSHFWAAAADGSKAIFTAVDDTGSLGIDQPPTGVDLYEFALEGEQTQLIAPGVRGVLGVSKDASRVYFGSAEVLGGTNSEGDVAVAGKANIYLYQAGVTEFIATLASEDVTGTSPFAAEPRLRNSRISPDGLHAAFMSRAPLTGYDNKDATSGKAAAEVFLYDAVSKELLCASCNPSGARPIGVNIGAGSQPSWVAAKLPFFQNTLYGARALSEDGTRLYFGSTDVLVPRDTNGVQDVYEWEELGEGSCDQGDATFSVQAGGCIDLISSGKSLQASEFIDADPDGSDVFFATLSSLLSEDYGLVDIYDARVDGGLPPPPLPPAACEGDACQSPASPPNDPTPASASFKGKGNQVSGARPRRGCPKGKRRARGKGKARCVKRANHKHGRAGR